MSCEKSDTASRLRSPEITTSSAVSLMASELTATAACIRLAISERRLSTSVCRRSRTCSSARPTDPAAYPSYGHSLVVDPWGTVLAEAGIGEQVLRAELDLTQVALARQAIPTSLQRRTDLYRLEQA